MKQGYSVDDHHPVINLRIDKIATTWPRSNSCSPEMWPSVLILESVLGYIVELIGRRCVKPTPCIQLCQYADRNCNVRN